MVGITISIRGFMRAPAGRWKGSDLQNMQATALEDCQGFFKEGNLPYGSLFDASVYDSLEKQRENLHNKISATRAFLLALAVVQEIKNCGGMEEDLISSNGNGHFTQILEKLPFSGSEIRSAVLEEFASLDSDAKNYFQQILSNELRIHARSFISDVPHTRKTVFEAFDTLCQHEQFSSVDGTARKSSFLKFFDAFVPNSHQALGNIYYTRAARELHEYLYQLVSETKERLEKVETGKLTTRALPSDSLIKRQMGMTGKVEE